MSSIIFTANSMREVECVYDFLCVLNNLNIVKISGFQFAAESNRQSMVCTLSDDYYDYI